MNEPYSKQELLETIQKQITILQQEITQLKNLISHYKQMEDR